MVGNILSKLGPFFTPNVDQIIWILACLAAGISYSKSAFSPINPSLSSGRPREIDRKKFCILIMIDVVFFGLTVKGEFVMDNLIRGYIGGQLGVAGSHQIVAILIAPEPKVTGISGIVNNSRFRICHRCSGRNSGFLLTVENGLSSVEEVEKENTTRQLVSSKWCKTSQTKKSLCELAGQVPYIPRFKLIFFCLEHVSIVECASFNVFMNTYVKKHMADTSPCPGGRGMGTRGRSKQQAASSDPSPLRNLLLPAGWSIRLGCLEPHERIRASV